MNDQNLVPLRWLFITVGASFSCFATSLYYVFSAGSLISALSMGQQNIVGRVGLLEKDKEKTNNEILQRLTVVETQNKLILDAIEGRRK